MLVVIALVCLLFCFGFGLVGVVSFCEFVILVLFGFD